MDESSTGPAEQRASRAQHGTPNSELGTRFVVEIPLNRIDRNEQQPRVEFAEAELEELAASIRRHGVLQPLLVVRKPLDPGQPEHFEIVAGERRWRASQRAGLATVPCIVHDDLSERERLEISLVENVQRKDLNPIEEARAYQRLHQEFELTHEEIGKRVGKSRPQISNMIRLLDLPEAMKTAVMRGELTYGEGRALLSLLDPLQRQMMFEKMLKGQMSAGALERIQRGRKRRQRKEGDPEVLNYEQELAKTLGAPVRIKPMGLGGVIEVDYFSWEELSGIIERIRSEKAGS